MARSGTTTAPYPALLAVVGLVAVVVLVGACTTDRTVAPSGAPSGYAASAGASTVPSAPPLTGRLVLWHPYGPGSPGLDAVTLALAWLRTRNPGLDVQAEAVDAASIFTRFEHESGLGGGPDLLLAPNDRLGDEARAGYLVDLTGQVDDSLGAARPIAQAGSMVDGRAYLVPWSVETQALYYDSGTIATPPATTDALLAFARGGGRLGVAVGPEAGWPFYGMFGGTIFDPAGHCAATANSGVSDAIAFVGSLRTGPGTVVSLDTEAIDRGFVEGSFDAILSSGLALPAAVAARPHLAIAAPPSGPLDPGTPLVGITGWAVNAAVPTTQQTLAIAVAQQLATAPAQQLVAAAAAGVPANASATGTNPLILALAAVADGGEPRPQPASFDAYRSAFERVWAQAIAGDGSAAPDPETLVAAGCAAMDLGPSPSP